MLAIEQDLSPCAEFRCGKRMLGKNDIKQWGRCAKIAV
jgi:hypothetical protein